MSRYGIDLYGLNLYGSGALVDFDARPVTATPSNYGEITVRWSTPAGTWDRFRLVRNTYGFPTTPDDGYILIDSGNPLSQQVYIDLGQEPNNSGLAQGAAYYYTIFVRQGDVDQPWSSAGSAYGVSVKNYNTADLMYEYIPTIQKINSMNSYITTPDETRNEDLYNFLSVFAFEYDFLKTLTELAKNRYDVLNIAGPMVPLLLNQFGLKYETAIGMQQSRTMLNNAIKMYSEKGSTTGIKTFVTAFTGYNCDIKAVRNLMLTLDDSSFKTSVGFWEGDAKTALTHGTVGSETPPVTPYQEPSSPSQFPNSALGFLKVAAVNPSGSDLQLKCGVSNPKLRGVPVTAGLAYTLTAYTQAKTTARTVKMGIQWYDMRGVYLSSATESTYTNTTSGWTRSTACTGTAPANAYFAVPYIKIAGTSNGEVHYVDAVQFEQGSSATSFVEARRIDVVIRANRINQVLNPSFEVNTTSWTFANSTGSRFADASSDYGNYCARAVTTADGTVTITTTAAMSALSDDYHSASGYIKGPATVTGRIKVTWLNASNATISTSTGPSVTLSPTSWQRATFEGLSPEGATQAKLQFEFTGCAATNAVYLDEVLFEKTAYVAPYFDGQSGYANLDDSIWESTAGNSRSHYYKNFRAARRRLISELQDYLPLGSAWAVFAYQPD